MPQRSNPPARTTPSAGFRSWTRERKIYLAVGILACIAGVLIMVFSR